MVADALRTAFALYGFSRSVGVVVDAAAHLVGARGMKVEKERTMVGVQFDLMIIAVDERGAREDGGGRRVGWMVEREVG